MAATADGITDMVMITKGLATNIQRFIDSGMEKILNIMEARLLEYMLTLIPIVIRGIYVQ
jgi:hypothetical protein